jgi:hypothetical protein
LRGQNKADIDAMLEKHEEFFNGEIKNKNIYVIYPRKPEESRYNSNLDQEIRSDYSR